METLPDTALILVNLIGLSATLALVEVFGGNELRIPMGSNGRAGALFQKISHTIGEQATHAISRHYGGEVLYIPNCSRTRRVLRDMEIVRAYDALILENSTPAAVSILARQYFLSCRCIEIIVNRPIFGMGKKS